MLKTLLLAASVSLALTGTASAADVTGVWHTAAQGGLVEVSPCGDSVCGRLVASSKLAANPDLKDSLNKNPALRTRPLKGLVFMQGFHRDGGAWSGGQLYNPADGSTYKGGLRLAAPDRLEVTGCIVSPICQTQVWVRAK